MKTANHDDARGWYKYEPPGDKCFCCGESFWNEEEGKENLLTKISSLFGAICPTCADEARRGSKPIKSESLPFVRRAFC